jgi:hypothetical protein
MSKSKPDKIDVEYKGLKEALKDPKIRKKIDETYAVETRLSILMAITNFGSANIKRLAKLLGKNDATIYHHIKIMTKEPALLEVDNEMTQNHKGIFYQLTSLARRHFGEPTPEEVQDKLMKALDMLLEQSDEELYRIYIDMIANHPNIGRQADIDRGRISYNHILENIMLRNLEQAEKAFMSGKKPKNKSYPLGSLANIPLDIKIAKPRHIFEILRLIMKMSSDFHKLRVKFEKQMDKEKIPQEERLDVHFHIVGGEIAEFEFE